jgi:hypothetical protein
MGCGSEGDEEMVMLLEDFEASERRIIELQALLDPPVKKSSTQ